MKNYWKQNKICSLLAIEYPIIQGGMVYNSGARLVAAVSNAGGLGLIGSGSMSADILRDQIRKTRTLTDKPFGINLPLLYAHSRQSMEIALEEGIKIFFTSAGSPRRAISPLKKAGCVVVHVVSSPNLAVKCEEVGCDAVVCEGFEAGGHNGREELTTMVLVPQCVAAVNIPVIAAGGIATGAQLTAALALGADAVQIGSRFAVTEESSGHLAFKEAVAASGPADTHLVLKSHVPVRLLRNSFRDKIMEMEKQVASKEDLVTTLGKGRARAGMLDGDLEEGELEIGQAAGLIGDIPSVAEVMERLIGGHEKALENLKGS